LDKKHKKIVNKVKREFDTKAPLPETAYDKIVDKLIDEKTELYDEIIKLKKHNHRLKKQIYRLKEQLRNREN
jgi:predicted  nucleic acid-binding Zn-ribbon protein